MMHYFMQRVNTTLVNVDKSHDYRLYKLLNGSVQFSFAYYPKFWLNNERKHMFGQVLRKLIQM